MSGSIFEGKEVRKRMKNLPWILLLILCVAVISVLVYVEVRAGIAMWNSDIPWWMKLKLITGR